jgi:broad specificity phosphatase PhoE
MADDTNIQDIQQPDTDQQSDNGGQPNPTDTPTTPDYKLWNYLNQNQLYTKSYNDFKTQFSDPKNVQWLHDKLSNLQLYTKSADDFTNTYFPATKIPQPPIKSIDFNDLLLNQNQPYLNPSNAVNPDEVDHAKDVAKAKQNIADFYNSQASQTALKNITGRQNIVDVTNQMQAGKAKQDATSTVIPNIIRTNEQVQQQNQNYMNQAAASGDDTKTRAIMNEAQRTVLPKDDANKLAADAYVADSEGRVANHLQIMVNAQKIKDGDYGYDAQNKTLIKNTGFGTSFANSLQQHSKLTEDYNFFHNSSDQDIINELEKRRLAHDPDVPVDKPNGWKGSLGDMLGSSVVPIVKQGAAAKVATAIVPELAIPANTLAALFSSTDFYQQAYASKLANNYSEYRDKGMSQQDALQKAQSDASLSGNLAYAQGVAMMSSMPKLGKAANVAEGINFSDKTVKILGNIASNSGLASVAKSIENYHEGKPVAKGTLEAFGNNALFMGAMLGFHALAEGGTELTKGAYTALKDNFSKIPPETLETVAAKNIEMGNSTPEQAAKTLSEIQNHAPTKSPDTEWEEKEPELQVFKKNAQTLKDQEPVTEKDQPVEPVQNTQTNIPIEVNKKLETIDYGDFKGKEEDEQSKKEIDNQILSNDPVGKTGDTFSGFLERVIPEADRITKEEDHNTIAVSNSSAIKAVQIWEELGKPDVKEITGDPEKLKDFAQRFIDKQPIEEGSIHTMKGDNGKEIHIVRHGETDDNVASEFREDNAQLTDKGVKEASKAGEKLSKILGTERPPKIISSDLPRTMDTATEIANHFSNNKTSDNAIPEQTAGKVGLRNEPTIREGVGGQNGSVQPAEESNRQPKEENQSEDKEKNGDVEIAHKIQEERTLRLNTGSPERGQVDVKNFKESADRGDQLVNSGVNPDEIESKFNKDKSISTDALDVVNSRYRKLANATDAAEEQYTQNSPQYKSALAEERQWYNRVVKPMQTEWSRLGFRQQTSLDAGSFRSVKENIENNTGKPMTSEQSEKVKSLVSKNKELKSKADDSENKLIKATEDILSKKEPNVKAEKSIKATAKRIADIIRKGKLSRPDIFSSATPASLVWDGALEAAAKTVEGAGTIAQAIADGLDHIKNSEWYKNLTADKKDQAEKAFTDFINNQSTDKMTLAEKYVNKKGNKFTPEEAKEIYGYMKKTYLDKGVNWRDAIGKVSDDTGLSYEQVSHAIVTPKTKPISDAMWKQQYDLEKNRLATQRYVDEQGKNAAIKAFNKVANSFREMSVFGHGGVFVGTHAGMTLMDLPRAKYTVKAFFNAYDFAYGKTADYQIAMTALKKMENYVLAQRYGLKNNPDIIDNDAEIIAPLFGKLSESGKRGFNAIKILRQDLFDSHYNSLSDEEKADPGSAISIAKLVNNATGASNLNIPALVNNVTFAGGMEVARWGKLTRNPINATRVALNAMINPENVSVEDKVFAKVWAKRVGTELATFAGVLTLNAAIQSKLYPHDKYKQVNLFDPTKSDWLKPKIGNTTFDFTSGMLSTFHFAEEMGRLAIKGQPDRKGETVTEEYAEKGLKYGTGKLSPFYGDITEAATRHDYEGNTLPWSNAKPLNKFNHKLSWEEYAASKLPLPVAAGFKAFYDQANQKGLNKSRLDAIMNGIMYGAVSGTTGFKAYEDHEQKENKSHP